MSSIKQIEDFKSKYLRMAGFVEYVQQVTKLVNLLKMFKRFSYDTEKKAAADYLWNIVKKYGVCQ